jgi:hypothetical protein
MSKKNREKRARKKLIPMTPAMREAVEEQLQAFREKFHREMGPDDPIFFDPDADTPQLISEAKMAALFEDVVNEAARRKDISPELLYAMRKTGRMVTEQNKHLLTPEQVAEWNAAIDEYHTLN